MHMMIAAENTPSRDLSAPVDLLADVLMDLLFNGGQGYLHSPQLQRCADFWRTSAPVTRSFP